jgi:hypothetical protein
MKKTIPFIIVIALFISMKSNAQKSKSIDVPEAVKSACKAKYPDAKHVTWEKEKGNYEANWGGKSGEDNSVQFSPTGEFIEIVKAMPVSQLPAKVTDYVKSKYKGFKITEAGRVTDAKGNESYEVEVNRKDLIFDKDGNFLKKEN